jgi:N-acetylglucosaminyldiphosphoundecaprenol N-acetyl-beta-D-mannosaminyltransferase
LFVGDVNALIAELLCRVAAHERTLLITPNVDQVLLLEEDTAWREAWSKGDIFVADGMPIVALGRALGAKELHRITGADLLPTLVSQQVPQLSVAILGGSDESRQLAVKNLSAKYPYTQLLGVGLPVLKNSADPRSKQAVAELNAAQPDVVFLCLGAPKQELWYATWRDELPPAVYVGAGAAVDFAAGMLKRAPKGMQRIGLEWLYRLIKEPRRLAYRYLVRGPRWLCVVGRSVVAALRRTQ